MYSNPYGIKNQLTIYFTILFYSYKIISLLLGQAHITKKGILAIIHQHTFF